MTILIIYATFILLVVVLLLVNAYFINEIISKQRSQKKLDEQLLVIEPIMKKHLKTDIDKIKKSEIETLKAVVLTKKGLEAFNVWCQNYINEYGFTDNFKSYVDLIIDYKRLLENKIVRERYRNSYVLYLLSLYKLDSKETFDYAFNLLEDKSLYSRNNALRVIQNSKDEIDMVRALNIVDKSTHFFNDKIIIDFLTEFAGSRRSLNDLLVKKFDVYSERIKKLLIEYFINTKDNSINIQSHMYDLLKKNENTELVIASTKYFGKVINEKAKDLIMKNLDSEQWEVRAISGKVIEFYYDELVILKLKQKLSDSNWFVRFNCALSLINVTEGVDRRQMIKLEDRYAREIYIYALFTKGLIDIDEYNELTNAKDTSDLKKVVSKLEKVGA